VHFFCMSIDLHLVYLTPVSDKVTWDAYTAVYMCAGFARGDSVHDCWAGDTCQDGSRS